MNGEVLAGLRGVGGDLDRLDGAARRSAIAGGYAFVAGVGWQTIKVRLARARAVCIESHVHGISRETCASLVCT